MSTIRISGMIVPSSYDDEFMAGFIDRGMLTPLSRVERGLDEAEGSEPLNVRINSQGGSVFAAHQMVNAINEWRQTTGQPVSVTIGALAASAAATIAVHLGPVKAHANSLLMFHSASAAQIGGPEAMEDMAELLGQINAQVKAALTSRYNIDAEQVDEWFSEGRMGWLNADEAQSAGIVSEIVDEPTEPIAFAPEDVAALAGHGLDVAALMEPTAPESVDADPLEVVAELYGIAPGTDICAALIIYKADEQHRQDTAYDAGLAAGRGEIEAELEDEWKAKVADAEASAKTAAEEAANIRAEVDELKAANLVLAAKVAAFDKGFRGPTGSTEGATFWDVVQQKQEDGTEKNKAILDTQRECPGLYQEMLAEAKRTKNQ